MVGQGMGKLSTHRNGCLRQENVAYAGAEFATGICHSLMAHRTDFSIDVFKERQKSPLLRGTVHIPPANRYRLSESDRVRLPCYNF